MKAEGLAFSPKERSTIFGSRALCELFERQGVMARWKFSSHRKSPENKKEENLQEGNHQMHPTSTACYKSDTEKEKIVETMARKNRSKNVEEERVTLEAIDAMSSDEDDKVDEEEMNAEAEALRQVIKDGAFDKSLQKKSNNDRFGRNDCC